MRNSFAFLSLAFLSAAAVLLCLPLQAVASGPISAGHRHSCALDRDGTVACWGNNFYGRAGVEERPYAPELVSPVRVAGLEDVTAVATGRWHSCAVYGSGTVSCWGRNLSGQLGNGGTSGGGVPVLVQGLGDAIDVAVGEQHSCALHAGGTVSCWGDNEGQQVAPAAEEWGGYYTTPQPIAGLSDIVAIDAGVYFTCGLSSTGRVQCWGSGGSGVFGITDPWPDAGPMQVPGVEDAVALSAGRFHVCAVLADGRAKCWGSNLWGEVGNGSPDLDDPVPPTAVLNLDDAVAISAGAESTCALRQTGTVACWGNNGDGQLGDGTREGRLEPVEVAGLSGVVAISVGSWHACAQTDVETLFCWGTNASGNLGTNVKPVYVQPVRPRMPAGAKAISVANGLGHSCAILEGGQVACWGSNAYGESGDPSPRPVPRPALIPGLADVVEVSLGQDSSCAREGGGKILCWGGNHAGQLGNGTFVDSAVPVAVEGIDDASSIAAGWLHACATRSNGTASCWGRSAEGQLGNGMTGGDPVPLPQPVPGMTDAARMSAGAVHTCLAEHSGNVYCWGYARYGQLGIGEVEELHVPDPMQVPGLDAVADVVAGFEHSCALTDAGDVYCWGWNDFGEVGVGTIRDIYWSPEQLQDLPPVARIASGWESNCAVLMNGRVACWGHNEYGNIGDGTRTDRFLPTLVPGLEDVAQVATGRNHSCALRNDGEVRCWGSNLGGRLGIGDTSTSYRPQPVQNLQDRIFTSDWDWPD